MDDCYNANPTSDRAAIDSLASLSGRHVCILGDMLEMGGNAPELHRSVGEYAAAHGVDLVITQGELAKYIAEARGRPARITPIAHRFSLRSRSCCVRATWYSSKPPTARVSRKYRKPSSSSPYKICLAEFAPAGAK